MIDTSEIKLECGRSGCAMQWAEALRLAREGREVTREEVAMLTDESPCVSLVIGEFVRAWNDAMPDEARTRLLAPLLPLLLDTATGDDDDQRRAWMAADWLVRFHAPAWLELTPSLVEHAAALRALPELDSRAAAGAAKPIIRAAWDAAVAPAREARAAAWDLARAAAAAAAGDAAWDAAGYAAEAGAWNSARDAAGAAAGAAAQAAARDATRDALSPITATLQASASDLLRRMCELGR